MTSDSTHIVDRLAPGWLVVQFLGTSLILVGLVTAEEHVLWIWGVYLVSALCWFLFMAVQPWRPRAAVVLLACSALLPATAMGAAHDSTATLMLCVLLARFTSLTTPSGRALVAVPAACVLALWFGLSGAGKPVGESLGYSLLILVLTLLGLNRRQSQVHADQAEQMLEQTLLMQQERTRSAALDERTRIAREMHDVLAHSLGALSIQLKLAAALIEKGATEDALARVVYSNQLADEGLVEARSAVAALRGDAPSLPDALADLVEAHRAGHHSDVVLRTLGEFLHASPAVVVALVQAAREALTNASRHAPGEPLRMTVDYSAPGVRLTVENDVPPNNPGAPVRRPGYGLAGMRERLTHVGGTLVAARGDDGRWVLVADVPECDVPE